jgi:hypothetical protein
MSQATQLNRWEMIFFMASPSSAFRAAQTARWASTADTTQTG